jgi:hypothetical protein
MKAYPYGLADFRALRQDNYFYADRTDMIPAIEQAGKQLIFLRPRRFGKSLLVSMLASYYDLNQAEEFDKLFGDLAIGRNPTSRHSQYFVLRWDFSKVLVDADPSVIQQNLFKHINGCIRTFYQEYSERVHPEAIDPDNAIVSFENLLLALQPCENPLYVLIDEYDNFANNVAMSQQATDHSRYDRLLVGEGSMKTVFATLKAAVGEGRLDRLFVTGVSPMVLSDMTSGFNTAINISFEPPFAQACGFTETEVRTELTQLTPDVDEVLNRMRLLYNGYSFDPDQPETRLYHPTLALYFLDSLLKKGKPPDQPLDTNLRMDKDKISWFAHVIGGNHTLQKLTEDSQLLTVPGFAMQFQLEQLLEKNVSQDDLAILITYFGMATLAGRNPYNEIQLRIPNTVIRSLYIDELRQRLVPDFYHQTELKDAANQVFRAGDIEPLCELMENRVLHMFSNRDYRHGEATVKSAFMTALFNDTQYLPISEATVGRRYADAVFLVKSELRHTDLKDILVEFKDLKLSDLKMDATQVNALSREELQRLPQVIASLSEAREQRHAYAQSLLAQYPQARLHPFTVVCLGFERLVWETSPPAQPDAGSSVLTVRRDGGPA